MSSSIRRAVRPLSIESLAEAYPLELLADFATGNITLVKEDGSTTVLNKNPGKLTVKQGSTTLLNAGDMSGNLTININEQTSVSGNAGTATKMQTDRTFKIGDAIAKSFNSNTALSWTLADIGAAASGHTHTYSDVGAAAASHKHAFADLTGVASSSHNHDTVYSPIAHTHSYSDIGAAAADHNHDDVYAAISHGTHVSFTSTAPKAPGTAAAGTATTVSRSDHVHPLQTTISGNAGSATKLQNARTLTVGNTGKTFDGSGNVEWTLSDIGAAASGHNHDTVYSPIAHTHTYDEVGAAAADHNHDGIYAAASHGTHVSYGTSAPLAAGTASAGTASTLSRSDHVHPLQTSVSGNAGTATKLATARKLTIGSTGKDFDGSSALTWTLAEIGAAASGHTHTLSALGAAAADHNHDGVYALASHGTHVSYGTSAPAANGTASAGSASTVSRSDHVHPLQTSVSGNAGSATKLATARNFSITGGATAAAVSFNGTGNVALNVTSLDATKISGIIPLASIPQGALERLIPVADQAAMLALTTSTAQNGDVVKNEATGLMYYIKDESKFGTMDAFEAFTAGTASAVAWSNVTGKPTFATVATSGSYNDLSNKPSIPSAYTSTPAANGTASAGSASTWARGDHVHPLQTSVSGNAGTATKLATARTLTIGNKGKTFDGSGNVVWTLDEIGAAASGHNHDTTYSAIDHTHTYSDVGAAAASHKHAYADLTGVASSSHNHDGVYAAASHGTHVSFTTTVPLVAGTAAVGTATTVSRSDHVHPAQTSVSGNAGTATKLATARKLTIGSTGKDFDGSGALTWTLTEIGAAASGHNHNGVYAAASHTHTLSDLGAAAADHNHDGVYAAASHGTHVSFTTTAPLVAGTAAVGTASTVSRSDHVHPAQTSVSGNAGTATKLATARTLTIGSKGKTFDGSGNVAWTLSEIGAAAAGHTHTYSDVGAAAAGHNHDGVYAAASHGTHVSFTTTAPLVAGTAAVGTASTVSRSDHVHPAQTSVSGNAGTATKLATARTLTIGSKGKDFDGSGNVAWTLSEIGAAAASHNHDGVYAAASHGTHVSFTTTAPLVAGTAAVGTATTVSRSDHVHPAQTSVSGNAGTATKLATARKLTIGSTGKDFDGSSALTWTLTEIGAAAASHGTHVTFSTTNPLVAGTASVGTASTVSRSDHVHPAQTSVSGNAGTATKLATARKLTIGNTGKDFDGSGALTWTLSEIGAAAASHGTHVSYGTTAPLVAGTASVGSASTVSRSDHVHPAQTSVSGNAGTATKLANARKLTIGSTGKDFDGSAALSWSLSEIGAAASSHSHTIDSISRGTSLNVAGGVSAINAAKFDVTRACRTAFMPAAAIIVEYTQNNGSTWTDYGATDDQKRGLFSLNRGWSAALGKSGTVTVGHGVRITVIPTDRYAYVDNFYCWFSTNGHTCKLKIERSTLGAKTTFSTVRENLNVNGWSGPNDIGFSGGTFGGSDGQTSNYYSYRFTFMVTAVNSSYTGSHPTVTDLRMYGDNAWVSPNSMMYRDHIYIWDINQNVSFPASVSAASFNGSLSGNATSASKLATARTLTIGNTGKSFDGSGNVSWSLSEIGAAAASHGTHVTYSSTAPAANGTAAVGTATTVSRSDHVHPLQTSVSGNAGTATKLATARTLTIGSKGKTFDGSDNVSWTLAEIGAAAASHGTHVSFSTDTPKAAGTAAVGTATTVSRSDHVHPLQTTVSGNAGTATKLATARKLTIGSTGKDFDGSGALTWSLSEIGAAASGHTHTSLGALSLTGKLTVNTSGNVSGISVAYSATIGTSWSGSGPYTQTITVSGITANDIPIVDFVPSGTYATDQSYEEAFGQIYRITTAANSITVYAHEATTVACPIRLLVVR